LEEPAMAKARSLVGLDVHAAKIVAAVLDADTGELRSFSMKGETRAAAGFCAGLPRPVRVAYEAGPTGYVLARELAKRRVECVVAAPSKIPRATGDRVKTDARDAEHLARLLLAGKLHPVRVPGPEEEALRDLVRARETLRLDLMRTRHRLSKMLMRHGVQFDDGRAWTDRHRAWLKTVCLEWPAAQTTLLDLEGVIDVLVHRREHLEREIVAILPGSPWETQVGRLRCLRGVDTLTAVGLCAEIGDFERFARAEQLMSYLGLVPSESTTGNTRRLGSITKTGSAHARRLLVEAAWALPQSAGDPQDPDRPTGRPTRGSCRDRLERTTPVASHLGPARSAQQTPDDHRGRRGPRARRVLLGDRPNRVRRAPRHLLLGRLGRWRPGTRGEPAICL
jgi:transposase